MFLQILCLSTLGVIHAGFGTSEGGRKYRSLGRVDYNEDSFRCPREGFHPDPRDCRGFYRCVDYASNYYSRDYTEPLLTAFRFECDEGTVFDPDYNVCNHPRDTRRAECRVRYPEGGQNPHAYLPPDGQNPHAYHPPDGQNPHAYLPPDGQNGGYRGLGQGGYPGAYPGRGNQGGDLGLRKYNKPEYAQTVISNETPVNLEDDCMGPGFYPIKGDCKTFIRCLDNGNGRYAKYEFSCGAGTVWDPANSICNNPSKVPACGGKAQTPGDEGQNQTKDGPTTPTSTAGYSTTTAKPEGSKQSQPFPGSCKAPGFYSVPGNCKKFIRCVDNGNGNYAKHEFDCGEGTAWDNKISACNHANMVEGCENQTPTNEKGGAPGQGGTTTQTPTVGTPNNSESKNTTGKPDKDPSKPPPGSSPCDQNKLSGPVKCEKDGYFPDTGDCSKFYRCADWGNKNFSVYYFECGKGTIWDPALETCNHEKSVQPPRKCNTPSSEQKPTSTESTPPTTTGPSTVTTTQKPRTTRETTEKSPTTSLSTEAPTTSSVGQTETTTTTSEGTTVTTESVPTTLPSTAEPTTKPSTKPPSATTTEYTERTTSNPGQTESTTLDGMTTMQPHREGETNCPHLNEGQAHFVCPTGFRRHPRNCHLFYQCTTSKLTGDFMVMSFTCKNYTLFDEEKIQCLPEEETEPCRQEQGRRVYRSAEYEFSSVIYVPPYKRLCPEEGSFPYEDDCTRFYKCKKDMSGKIQGYLNQCPENYFFDDTTARCEESSELSRCERSIPGVTDTTLKRTKKKVPVGFASL